MKLLLAIVLSTTCLSAVSSEPFKDVPSDHWAAGAVQKLKDEGIVQGYPDGTFRGDQPVTRYELAAALVRFVEFLQESDKPLAQSAGTVEKPAAKPESKEPAGLLVEKGFLPKDSALAKDVRKPVTLQELADALASVAKRLIELSVPQESATPAAAQTD